MAYRKGGALVESMIKKYGSYEAWVDHMREIAAKGGKQGTGHEFAHGRLDPTKIGKLGGRPMRGDVRLDITPRRHNKYSKATGPEWLPKPGSYAEKLAKEIDV